MPDLRRAGRAALDRLGLARPRPLVLMYHRIADLASDPWALAVSPQHFAEQLDVLAATRTPLHMSDFVRRLVASTLPTDAVAVTFDDGYLDNLRAARPLLAAANVPATLFLAAGIVGPAEYWWDELQRLVFTSRQNPATSVTIGGEPAVLDWEDQPSAPHPDWRAWGTPATRREAAYSALWGKLRLLPVRKRDAGLAAIRAAVGDAALPGPDRPMTRAEVAEHVAGGLIELGAHTMNHPVLPALAPDERRAELVGSKKACEAITGAPVQGFAYPHGELDPATEADVEAAGFTWACSTQARAVTGSRLDLLALPRHQAPDLAGGAFERALRLM